MKICKNERRISVRAQCKNTALDDLGKEDYLRVRSNSILDIEFFLRNCELAIMVDLFFY